MLQGPPWLASETYPLENAAKVDAENGPRPATVDLDAADPDGGDPVPVTPIASLADFTAFLDEPVTELVYVPLLHRRLRVRAPTALDMQAARLATQTTKGNRTVPRGDRDQATHLVYLCTITDNGDRFFPHGYITQLMAMPYGVIQPLAQVILRLAGLDEEANEREERDAF